MTNRKRQILLWLLSLLIWYTLFGFFVAPRLLKAIVLWQLPKQIHREVALTKIRLNPYTVAMAIEGLEIREPDRKPFVSCDEIYVNFDPTALLSHKFLVADFVVSNAYIHVQVNQDGSLNFSDILNQFTGGPTKPSTGKLLVLLVSQLQIIGSRVEYDDFSRATPFATMVGPIDLTLHDFSTDPANRNPYGFTAATESGEKIAWRGFFFLGPIRSSGDFTVKNIKLNKYAPYYNDFVNLTIHDGTMDVRSSYEVEFTDHLTVAKVSKFAVSIHSLKIAERGAVTNVIEIPEFGLGDTYVDAIAQTARIGTLSTHGARFEVQRLGNGVINLLNLLPPTTATNTGTTTAANTNTPLPAWTAAVDNINIQDFDVHVTGFLGEERMQWEALQFANIKASLNPLSLAIETIALHEPIVDVTITEDLAKSLATPSVGETNTLAEPASPKTALPPIKIQSVIVANGTINYDDKSLQPAAVLSVDKFDVTIDGLSTEAGSRADIHVNGQVDNIAPIELNGHINPLDMDAATDLQATVKGIDLLPVGSYSGHYLGYLVRKGKLSVQLQYDINHRQLKAQNQIVIDQFIFGDKTDSPDALKLPVKLGVAILKDRTGKILIDVPVEGRIDDPKFRYWGALWHVIGNLFTKIFTAPFSMIGSMFGGGGGEELSSVTFAPGSATIAADQTGKLDVLVKALTERPALNLEIAGSIDPLLDNEPLNIQKLDRYLIELRAKREPGATNALSSVERAAYLRQAYAEALPKILEIQAAAAATNQATAAETKFHSNISNLAMPGAKSETTADGQSSSRAKKVAAELSVEEMQRQYLPLIQLNDDDARPLTAARVASAIAYFKAKGQIADDRLLVSNNPKAPVLKEGARAVFSLE